jgi:hypothetical protein
LFLIFYNIKNTSISVTVSVPQIAVIMIHSKSLGFTIHTTHCASANYIHYQMCIYNFKFPTPVLFVSVNPIILLSAGLNNIPHLLVYSECNGKLHEWKNV